MIKYSSEFILDTQSKHCRPRVMEALIHLSDEGITEAREVLIGFTNTHSTQGSRENRENSNLQSEFGLVRTYEALGTGFNIDDPIAPGSIVVQHKKHQEEISNSYYYISPDRKGAHGEPIIYALNDGLLKKYDFIPFSRRLLWKSRLVYIENLEWGEKYGGDFDKQSGELFTCREKNSHRKNADGQPIFDKYSYDVWVKGSHMPERVRREKVYMHNPVTMIPIPTNT